MTEDGNLQTFKDLISLYISSSNTILDEEISYATIREKLHYDLTLDEAIRKAYNMYIEKYANALDSEFTEWFASFFHHSWLTEFCSLEIRDRNERVQKAYRNILETIYRTQSWMEEEKMRTKIEINWENKGSNYNLIHQTVTLFCDIVLACNQRGEYYISYNLDYRCQEMLTKYFTNTLLRRFYEFTAGDLEPFLKLNDLLHDGLDYFDNLLKESEKEESIKVYLVPKS